MDPATLTTSTFTLVKQGQSTPLPAIVSYAEPGRDARPEREPGGEHELHGDGQGRHGRGEGCRRQRARRRRQLELHDGASHEPAPEPGDRHSRFDPHLEGRRRRSPSRAMQATPSRGRCPPPRSPGRFSCSTAPRTAMRTRSRAGLGSPAARSAPPTTSIPPTSSCELTADDAGGRSATTTLRLDPQTVGSELRRFRPRPLSSRSTARSSATPFARTVIVGSTNSLSAPDAADAGRDDLPVLVVVGRRRPDPQRRRLSLADDLHRRLRDRASTRKPLASANPKYSLLSAAPDRRQRSLERVAADDALLPVAALRHAGHRILQF